MNYKQSEEQEDNEKQATQEFVKVALSDGRLWCFRGKELRNITSTFDENGLINLSISLGLMIETSWAYEVKGLTPDDVRQFEIAISGYEVFSQCGLGTKEQILHPVEEIRVRTDKKTH